jgi:hypothetical protein
MPISHHPGLVSYGSGENRPSVIHQAVCFPALARNSYSQDVAQRRLLFVGPRKCFSQKRQLSTTLSHFSKQAKVLCIPKLASGVCWKRRTQPFGPRSEEELFPIRCTGHLTGSKRYLESCITKLAPSDLLNLLESCIVTTAADVSGFYFYGTIPLRSTASENFSPPLLPENLARRKKQENPSVCKDLINSSSSNFCTA